nr:replication associated protein [Cressdnaviricota sp.]
MANVKWIDATIWCEGDNAFEGVKNESEWRKRFDGLFERYAYGRETAPETGRRHFQFRGVLKVACDAPCLTYLSSLGFRNITPTHVRDFEYVYKDKDFFCSWDVYRPEYDLVRDSPHVWQVQLEDLERDDRTIEVVWDERGNSGKTAWAMYQDYLHKAVYIPPLKRGLDLVACVLGKRESDWYIIDTPRAFEFTDDWACSIEQLKNGYVFDTRYSFRDRYLSVRPRITVLCNTLPEYEKYFSADRVLPFRITPEGYLWSV